MFALDNTFLFLFFLCLVAHLLRLLYSILKSKKIIDSKNHLIFFSMFTTMAVLWISFFQMCENDSSELNLSIYFRYIGLILSLVGLIFFIVPIIQLKGLENIDRLVTTGVYSFIRHPMYTGMIFWVIGYPLFMEAMLSLLTSILWIPNILYWRYLEEKELNETFNDYKKYKDNTFF